MKTRPRRGRRTLPSPTGARVFSLAALFVMACSPSMSFSLGKSEAVAIAGNESAKRNVEPPSRPLTSIEGANIGKVTSGSLRMGSDYARHQGQYRTAVQLARDALKKNYNDIDSHISYAEALENLLDRDPETSPALFNECVKEWLMVLRNEVGEEKGLSFHGISAMGKLYGDEEHSLEAKSHLVALTGRAPKPWETDTKYLRRVLRRESVSGTVVGDGKEK